MRRIGAACTAVLLIGVAFAALLLRGERGNDEPRTGTVVVSVETTYEIHRTFEPTPIPCGTVPLKPCQ